MFGWLRRQAVEPPPPPMHERRLPAAVLGKAFLQGYEYAWRLEDVPEVLAAARACELACLGGQVQFRVPEGTCELYWRPANSTPRRPGEPWPEYVRRAAEEVLAGVRALPPVPELVTDGARSFGVLGQLQAGGVELAEYLCMVLYFDAEQAEPGAAPDTAG